VATKDVKQLAALEQRWLRKQHRIVKDRAGAYERKGVYAAWRDIFQQYASLARQDMEALKRALYFAWTQCSQSPLLSGVKDLDDDTVREIFAIADELAGTNRLDAELPWMLSYYYLVEPRYLDRFDDLENLKRLSRETPLLYRQQCLQPSFKGRGHMGQYWRSKQVILRLWP
jgi:hypothetical protein